jgi:D-alanyl-lipoteichoic acid acyltransferase DltB (MBOAT superfamily)
MSFNSFEFAIFFPVILLLLRMTTGWLKLCILLASNLLFLYVLGLKHVVFMVNVIVISYIAGILIEKYAHDRRGKIIFLTSSVVLLVSPLIYYKYYGFISCLGNLFNGKCIPIGYVENYSLILPLGISFYTLQAISYVADVYYTKSPSEKNFLYFANFKSFFPQLVAGPIERVNTLLPQIKSNFKASEHDLHIGLAVMVWGFFKKIVIADNLNIVVAPVFANPQNFDATTLMIATLAFTIQIYCDFSGYTDIATGAARMMGIRLSLNFNNPYFATSVTNFWHRWHISLSTWFRDYIYLPMGGNKRGVSRMYLGLVVVFVVSGIWHGANFTFLVWAAIHLLAIIVEKIFASKRVDEVVKFGTVHIANWSITMLTVMVGWIFFRAKSVQDGIYIVKSIFASLLGLSGSVSSIGINDTVIKNLYIGLIAAFFMFIFEYFHSNNIARTTALRWISLRTGSLTVFGLVIVTLALGNFGRSAFIYFQF